MQVSNPTNNVKIYNLSCGKSLPEFITDRKRRSLLKNDVNLRRRIELIQDFEMPTVSTTIRMSRDQQYIFATGTYKPRVRCYDVNDLSLKFERCLDSEVVTFDVLSEDYSKLVFLLNDRTVELHTQQGKHYNIRIPKFGRDFVYHTSNCDLMLVGAGPEIYRINLDQGRFLQSFVTQSQELNSCAINPDHQLVIAGGIDGKVECWDPRSKSNAGILDCAANLSSYLDDNALPKVTALKYKSALHMAVGTSTGHVMLYDIRSNKPYLVKDHRYDLPIHSIYFNPENQVVISSDARVVKLWNETTGDPVTAVEMESDINDLHVCDNSGLFFLANESPKIHTYFIPMLGPAPRWCSFLDSLTEEMEENPQQEIYDDYKFLTRKDIDELGLTNLIGTSLLRAYMHGYFVDIRLYHKALAIANPFAYKEYRKKKIEEKIEEGRINRAVVKKLPKVNRNLADRLMTKANEEEPSSGKKKLAKKEAANLLDDPRFKAMFEDPSYQVDEESEEFRLLNPVLSNKFEKKKAKSRKVEKIENESSSDKDVDPEASSDDEVESRRWIRDATEEKKSKSLKEKSTRQPKLFQIRSEEDGKTFRNLKDLEEFDAEGAAMEKRRKKSMTLEERLSEVKQRSRVKGLVEKEIRGGREATFRIKQNTEVQKRTRDEIEHREERKKLRRPANKLPGNKQKQDLFFGR